MKFSFFTAANEKYFYLLEGMLESLKNQLDKGIRRLDSFDIIIFDDGLTPEQLINLENKLKDVKVMKTHDLKVANFYSSHTVNSMALRPHLCDYTDADVLIWIDADIWFQDKKALEDMLWATNHGDIAVVPEIDRLVSYACAHQGESFITGMFEYYGEEAATKFMNYPILNNGFFAAKKDSPVWELWQKSLKTALDRVDFKFTFGIDQHSLNYAVYENDLKFVPLPFSYNYNVRLSPMCLINKELCYNAVPFEKIQTIHLIGDAKWKEFSLPCRNEEGQEEDYKVITKLDYKSIKKLNKTNI